jgi:hypothetical protein
MYPHTKFGIPNYHGSGDMAHCMFSKMAAWPPYSIIENAEAKKMQFSVYHTKPYLQHKKSIK